MENYGEKEKRNVVMSCCVDDGRMVVVLEFENQRKERIGTVDQS